MTLFEGVMGRDWWQGRLCPSFIQFGYATPELVQRMQIYDAYDRCGYEEEEQSCGLARGACGCCSFFS